MEEREPHRATDIWPLVKRNAVAFITIGGLIIAIVTLYNQVTYMATVVNPKAVAAWQTKQAKQEAQLEAMKRLNDQRHCMVKVWFSGVNPASTPECLD